MILSVSHSVEIDTHFGVELYYTYVSNVNVNAGCSMIDSVVRYQKTIVKWRARERARARRRESEKARARERDREEEWVGGLKWSTYAFIVYSFSIADR